MVGGGTPKGHEKVSGTGMAKLHHVTVSPRSPPHNDPGFIATEGLLIRWQRFVAITAADSIPPNPGQDEYQGPC
jgi:hypothetical protein